MPSKIHEAAILLDFTSTLLRFAVTHDASELEDLLPEQLHMLARRFPEDSEEYRELMQLIAYKSTHQTH